MNDVQVLFLAECGAVVLICFFVVVLPQLIAKIGVWWDEL